MCGGAINSAATCGTIAGLSPRVRGSLVDPSLVGAWKRSIPACAGEPMAGFLRFSLLWVYPRVCGGALTSTPHVVWSRGLSPRVRGSRGFGHADKVLKGSIPACAGEPALRLRRGYRRWVYPRVCGGACAFCLHMSDSWGLSPRVRGSHLGAARDRAQLGSIPACAGEPVQLRCSSSQQAVYPRVCGGAVAWRNQAIGDEGLSPRVRGSLIMAKASVWVIGSIPACAGEPL
ncbi:protein of unknown function [Methylococcus capsulatus]|uniref:Uncharacterized protein n=1 Tax=Methylococcus capsulatus TaxID=414 RepID=A0AA35XX83_METCP|nr:protein of unknown function [Methylococcus capsulatus]